MKPKEYPALVDAVDSGVLCGLTRADKHAADPLTDAQRNRVHEQVSKHVMDAICERFHLEDAPED